MSDKGKAFAVQTAVIGLNQEKIGARPRSYKKLKTGMKDLNQKPYDRIPSVI